MFDRRLIFLVAGVALLVGAGALSTSLFGSRVDWNKLSILVEPLAAIGISVAILSVLSDRVFLERRPARKRRQVTAAGATPPNGQRKASREVGLRYYQELVASSRSLARGLYDRSGVYLIVGVFLAVAGVIAFYLLRPSPEPDRDAMDLIVLLLPGSSMLLLVELIAFFFLRQSRALMDEFRHFDNLARNREEVFAAISIAKEEGKPLDIRELLAADTFFTRTERLLAGESTEIVEARKLEKTEIDLLNKVVELISAKR